MERASSLDLFEAQHLPSAALGSSTEPAQPGPGPGAAPLWSTSPLPAQFGAGFPTFPAPTFWQPPFMHTGYFPGQAVVPSGIANGWPISDLAAPDPETAAFANSCIQLSQDTAAVQEGEAAAMGAGDAVVSSTSLAAPLPAQPALLRPALEAKVAPGPAGTPTLSTLPKASPAQAEAGTPSPTSPRSNGAPASLSAATPGRQKGLSSLSELLAPQNVRYSPSLGAWKVNAAGQATEVDPAPATATGGQAEPAAAQNVEPHAASEPHLVPEVAVAEQAMPVEQPELLEKEQPFTEARQPEVKAEVSIETPELVGDGTVDAPVAPEEEQEQEMAPEPKHPKPPPIPEPQQRLYGKAEQSRSAKRGAPLADDDPGEGRKRTRLTSPTAEPPRSAARVTRAAVGGRSQAPAVATRGRRPRDAMPAVKEQGRAATRSGRVYKTVQEEGETSEEEEELVAQSESEAEEQDPASSEPESPNPVMPLSRSIARAMESGGPMASRSSTRRKHGRLNGSYRELNEGEQTLESEAEESKVDEPEPEDQPGRDRARRRTLRRQAADLRVQRRRKEEAADASGSSEDEASDDEVPPAKGHNTVRQIPEGRRLTAKQRAPAESDEGAESAEGNGDGKATPAAAKNLPTFKDVVLAGLIPQGQVQLFVGAQRKQCHVVIGPTGELMHDKKLYRSLSAFAVSLLRERNPARQSADGWREVFFNGKPIYALREVLIKD